MRSCNVRSHILVREERADGFPRKEGASYIIQLSSACRKSRVMDVLALMIRRKKLHKNNNVIYED